jgi:hypothetical protein
MPYLEDKKEIKTPEELRLYTDLLQWCRDHLPLLLGPNSEPILPAACLDLCWPALQDWRR